MDNNVIQTKQYGDYLIYNDGRIYSIDLDEFVPIIDNKRSLAVRLYIDGKIKTLQVARLVAQCFCNPPNDYNKRYVEHIDNNYRNNHSSNLQWSMDQYNSNFVNYYNNLTLKEQNKMKQKISATHRRKQLGKGKFNSRFRYSIFDENNTELLMPEAAKRLGISLSRAYMIIYNAQKGKISPRLQNAKLRIVDHKNI